MSNIPADLTSIRKASRFDVKKQWFVISRSQVTKIILAGLILRLVILPITFHPWDMPALVWSARVFSLGDLNVYDTGLRMWIEAGWKGSPAGGSPISHGPLFYYLYGAWMWLLGLFDLFPVTKWRNPYNTDVLSPINIAFIKLPSIFFDIVAGLFISKIFIGNNRLFALGLWMFSPLSIYITYLIWQDDIFMVSFVAVALYCCFKSLQATKSNNFSDKYAVAAVIALGVGACFKLFPVFFVLPVAIILAKGTTASRATFVRKVCSFTGWGIAPIILVFLPQILFTKHFISSVLFSNEANGLSNSNFASGVGTLSWFWVLYFGLLVYLFFSALTISEFYFTDLIVALGAVCLLFFILNRYPANFLVWMLPVIIIMVGYYPKLLPGYFFMTVFFVFALQYFPLWLGIEGFWHSRDPEAIRFPSIPSYLSKFGNWNQLLTYLISGFVVTFSTMFILFIVRVSNSQFFFRRSNRSRLRTVIFENSITSYTKLKFFSPFLLFFFLIGTLFFLAVNDAGAYRIPIATTQNIEPLTTLTNGTEVVQGLIAPAGKLKSLAFQLDQLNRFNLAKLEFRLYKGAVTKGELVYSTNVDTLEIKQGFHTIRVSPPLELQQVTEMFFIIKSLDGNAEFSPALMAAPAVNIKPALPGTPEAIVNSRKTDKIVMFTVSYEVDWLSKLEIIKDYLNRTPLFSTLYYILCIVLFFVLMGLSALKYKKC